MCKSIYRRKINPFTTYFGAHFVIHFEVLEIVGRHLGLKHEGGEGAKWLMERPPLILVDSKC